MKTEIINLDKDHRVMKYTIERLVDYLYEESFFIDKDVIKDNEAYSKLFEEIYDIFKKNNILNFYDEEMKLYIMTCVIHNDDIDVNTLARNLLFIENDMKKKKYIIPDIDIENIQREYKPKSKVLKAS